MSNAGGSSPAARAIWAGLIAVMLLVGVAAFVSLRGEHAAPPVVGQVPEFSLTERSGETRTRADLDGAPWVADFIFTRCTGMCPALSTRLAEVRRRAREGGITARFVSFSVDPTHDQPAVLREYASRFGADGDDWLFLTGDRDALYSLIGGGFRLSVAERSAAAAAADGGELIAHSDRFVLVDGRGRIRGYYHGTDPAAVDAVLRDLAAVAAEG
jgi:protein SCO1/2